MVSTYIERKMILMVALRSKRDAVKPLLMKLGVALAFTFAGYLCSQFRTRKFLQPPSPGSKIAAAKIAGLKELQSAAYGKLHKELPKKSSDPAAAELSPSSKASTEEENLLLPEFNELVQKEFEATGIPSKVLDVEASGIPSKVLDVEASGIPSKVLDVEAYVQKTKPFCDSTEQEIHNLRNMVRCLSERERNLEIQLLEYYGLKEQESAVRELENRLKINNMETKFFSLKIESLLADNRRLQAQVADYSKISAELESARAQIKHLKRKLKSDGDQNKEHLSILQQKVAALQEEEQWLPKNDADVQSRIPKNDADVQSKLQRLNDLEDELAKLKSANSELQRENLELSAKLESTQMLASSIVENPEVKILEEEAKHLREANDDLEKEIDQLHMDRCTDAEELVYLKWVNACLRYELRDYQPSLGKTVAKDLSKSLSPKSEEKAKELIIEYATSGIDENRIGLMEFDSGYYTSSHESVLTEAGECDDNSFDTSAGNRNSSNRKSKFISKIKKLVSGKDSHNHHHIQREPHLDRRPSLSIPSSNELAATYSFNSASSCITMDPRSRSCNSSKFSISRLKEDEKTGENRRKSMTDIVTTPRFASEIQRQRKLSLQEIRQNEMEFPYGYKRTVLGEGGTMELLLEDSQMEHDENNPEKSELIKYAQVLNSSRGNLHRRSLSYDSFGNL